MSRRFALPAAGFFAIALGGSPARADLSAEAELLSAAWSARGLSSTHLAPTFLEHGHARAIALPASAYDGSTPGCTSVAFLTGRSTDFSLKLEPAITPKHRPLPALTERSAAGTLLMTRCGPAKSMLSRLSIELRVARSALEIVVAEGGSMAPPVSVILPERATGPLPTPGDPGPPPPIEAMQARIDRADSRAKRAGASSVRHLVLTPDTDGSGREVLRLEDGCHRLELFSESSATRRVDLDAELRDASSGRLLARDRADSPDARLEVCVGDAAGLELTFAGAAGSVPVVLSDARFGVPTGVPLRWGARARAAMAGALRRRQLPELRAAPVYEALGVTGVTVLPFETEPGACYLAAVAATHGEPRAIALGARIGARSSIDSNGGMLDGTAVSFCAGGAARANLEVEVRGSSASWVLAIWEVGAQSLEGAP